jgi:hypothetical protein
MPTITVSCPLEQEGVTNIVLNNRRAAELAIDHLAGLGHREIAVIKGQSFSSDTKPPWQAARGAKVRLNPKLVVQLVVDPELVVRESTCPPPEARHARH